MKQMLTSSIETVSAQIKWYQNHEIESGESCEDSIFALNEYKNALKTGMALMQETDKKFESADEFVLTIAKVVDSVSECGNVSAKNAVEISKVNIENVVNDLVDKILKVESEYNKGNLTIDKAYKYVQKIKNTFHAQNIQRTGIKDIDDEIEFLNYAIEESEKMYVSQNQYDTTETTTVY